MSASAANLQLKPGTGKCPAQTAITPNAAVIVGSQSRFVVEILTLTLSSQLGMAVAEGWGQSRIIVDPARSIVAGA